MSTPNPQRSPERQQLADAIAARTAAEQDVHTMREAIARARDAVTEAESQLSDAQAAAEASGKDRAKELAEAAAAGTAPPARPPSRRAAVAAAEDELAAARGALAGLKERLAEAEEMLRHAGHMVIVAADAVIRGRADAVLAKAVEAAAQLKSCRRLLHFLLRPERAGQSVILGRQPLIFERDEAARRARDEPFAALGAEIERFLDRSLQGIHDAERQWSLDPELGPWTEVRDALLNDPDPPLPTA
jgi:hypothetical protein